MTALYHAHSGLRFLVLLAAVVAILYFAFGLATKRPFDKVGRILGSVFVGLLDLQILLGLAMVALGLWHRKVGEHLTAMLVAAAVAHIVLARNRKREKPTWLAPLVGVGVSLVLIVVGILVLRPSIFSMAMTGG